MCRDRLNYQQIRIFVTTSNAQDGKRPVFVDRRGNFLQRSIRPILYTLNDCLFGSRVVSKKAWKALSQALYDNVSGGIFLILSGLSGISEQEERTCWHREGLGGGVGKRHPKLDEMSGGGGGLEGVVKIFLPFGPSFM